MPFAEPTRSVSRRNGSKSPAASYGGTTGPVFATVIRTAAPSVTVRTATQPPRVL